MGVFDWLRGSSDGPGDPPEEPRAEVDWASLEDALTKSIESQVKAFSASHPGERFYGFALDCNAYYANILFCLNSEESLEDSAREYAKENTAEEIARQKEDLKWGLGDWKYHGFNLDTDSWTSEVPMLDEFAELPSDQDTEQFLVTCCRALVRAETGGAFECLPRTPQFRVVCIDHDEDVHAGDRRLEKVRASF